MRNVSLDVSKLKGFINEHEIGYMGDMVNSAHNAIHNGTGAGNDFLGWLDLPKNYDKEEFERIKNAAERIKETSDVLIVIGIGGSYLGARAAIEMLTSNFNNILPKSKRKAPKVFFVGNNISSTYISELFEENKNEMEGAPFHFYAIGNPEQIEAALFAEGSHLNELVLRKLNVTLNKYDEMELPSASISISPKFMKRADN